MRILVISLLRLGDFLQIVPVLHALKSQMGARELDVLVHRSVIGVKPMLPLVTNWFTLDRDELQRGLGEADVPLLTSFSVLKEQMDELNAREYDLVINLTQTLQSGWLAGYLSAEQRSGLSLSPSGQSHFHSPWFRYLNDHHAPGMENVFHHTDIFFYGAGLKGAERDWTLRETRHGYAEVAALRLKSDRVKIVLQTRTSDEKKNWSQTRWIETLRILHREHPSAEFVALGAPNEVDSIDRLTNAARAQGIEVQKAILSLEGAHSLLRQADLLITGDTSIKHLANASGLAVLELSLGSSDYLRTGVYAPDSLILQPRVECTPCPHSSPCRQSTHACGLMLDSETVALSALHLIRRDWRSLGHLARERQTQVQMIRTQNLANGFWWPHDLAERDVKGSLQRLLDRLSWKMRLNASLGERVPAFGSEGLNLQRAVLQLHGEGSLAWLKQDLEQIERLDDEAFRAPLGGDRPRADATGVVSIEGVRRLQRQLDCRSERAKLKSKLIRTIRSQTMELI